MSTSVYLDWQGDFQIDELGNTLLADGDTAFVQRLIRRILTTPRMFNMNTGEPIVPPDYIASPEFGCGARRLVNMAVGVDEIKRVVTAQIAEDPEVDTTVKPVINVSSDRMGRMSVDMVVVRKPNVSIAFGLVVGA
jgi:hypothetical protein